MDERAYATLIRMLEQREQVLAHTSTSSQRQQAAEQLRGTFGYAIASFRDLELASTAEARAWEAAYPGVPPGIIRSVSHQLALQARERLQRLIDAEIAGVQAARPTDHRGYLKASTLIWAGHFAQLLSDKESEALYISLTAHLQEGDG